MKAKTIRGNTALEIAQSLNDVTSNGYSPTLAIVFLSAEKELEELRNILFKKGVQIFGSSSGSQFIDEEVNSQSIAILLLDTDSADFDIVLIPSGKKTTSEISKEIGGIGKRKFKKPSFIILSAGITTDGDSIVDGLKDSMGANTNLFGGMAADDLKMERTYVFTSGEFTENGLIFDDEKIGVSGLAVGGWKPIGIPRTITRSEGNVVYTIDNEPALDFIKRYSGVSDKEMENYILFLYSNFQFQLMRENRHPVMRGPLSANTKDRSLIFGGNLPQGSKVKLCLLPGTEVIDAVLKEYSVFAENQPGADAILMFSCAGRQLTLGPYITKEIEGIKKIWNVPVAGFFCYGEIGKLPNGNYEFHNMTCSLVTLKER